MPNLERTSGKSSLGSLLAEIIAEIRRHFAAAARRRDQEIIEREKQRVESEKNQREYQAKEEIRRAEEKKQKHSASLEAMAHARSEDLMKAAEWWRLHRVTMEFINDCEQRWRGNPAGELTTEQQAWLAWARENAKAISPVDAGYPDPARDGPFDAAAVPVGGRHPVGGIFHATPATHHKIRRVVAPATMNPLHNSRPRTLIPFG